MPMPGVMAQVNAQGASGVMSIFVVMLRDCKLGRYTLYFESIAVFRQVLYVLLLHFENTVRNVTSSWHKPGRRLLIYQK